MQFRDGDRIICGGSLLIFLQPSVTINRHYYVDTLLNDFSEDRRAVRNSAKLKYAEEETNGFPHNSDKRTAESYQSILPVYPKLIKIFHRSARHRSVGMTSGKVTRSILQNFSRLAGASGMRVKSRR